MAGFSDVLALLFAEAVPAHAPVALASLVQLACVARRDQRFLGTARAATVTTALWSAVIIAASGSMERLGALTPAPEGLLFAELLYESLGPICIAAIVFAFDGIWGLIRVASDSATPGGAP